MNSIIETVKERILDKTLLIHYADNDRDCYKRNIEINLSYLRKSNNKDYTIVSILFKKKEDYNKYYYDILDKEYIIIYWFDKNFNMVVYLYYNFCSMRTYKYVDELDANFDKKKYKDIKYYNIKDNTESDYVFANQYGILDNMFLYYKNVIILDKEQIKYVDIENYNKETRSDFRKYKINKFINGLF